MIPSWTAEGVIPPIRPGRAGHDQDRAPYRTTLIAVVDSFGLSPARREILWGLIEFRRELRGVGIREGFQWLDGSLFEDVERTRLSPPSDVDVVTFAALGDEEAQSELFQRAPHLFEPRAAKRRYRVDSYFVRLGDPLGLPEVQSVSYWYSMWSHRRGDQLWKGFAQVALEENDDAALARLEELGTEGGAT